MWIRRGVARIGANEEMKSSRHSTDDAERCKTSVMDLKKFGATLSAEAPPQGIPVTLAALWWEAKGDWTQAHLMVDELEPPDGMAVHAYLHRKEGSDSNANYWYE